MSSSRPKITSVTCTKCKQDFTFERVPKIASVTCPHCNTKIRLTRKPKDPTSSKPPTAAQPEAPQLPAPNPEAPSGDEPQITAPAEESSDFPKIKTRRTRKRINLRGLQFDDSDITDAEIDETEEAPFEIKTRRTRKRINLSNLQLDETDQPASVRPQPPVQPPKAKPPSNNQSTPDASNILPAGRRLRGNSPPKPTSKTNAPSPETTKPHSKTAETPPAKPLIAPSDRRTRSTPTPAKESIQRQTPDLPAPPNTADSTPTVEPATAWKGPSPSSLDTSTDEPIPTVSPIVASAPVFSAPIELEDENSLLPPRFLVADIEANENAVILPSATSGTQVASRTEVTVSHGGQTIKLVASSPEELRRIRMIENLVAVVIAGIILAIAVWVLL